MESFGKVDWSIRDQKVMELREVWLRYLDTPSELYYYHGEVDYYLVLIHVSFYEEPISLVSNLDEEALEGLQRVGDYTLEVSSVRLTLDSYRDSNTVAVTNSLEVVHGIDVVFIEYRKLDEEELNQYRVAKSLDLPGIKPKGN